MELKELSCDCMVIGTTRPQGYNHDFDETRYQHLEVAELTKEEADAYELTLGGMKTYYCVTSSVDDKGKVRAAITNVIDAACKPENSFKSLKHKDIYTDWFESREEAEKLVEEAKTA